MRVLIGSMWFQGSLWKLPLPLSGGFSGWTQALGDNAAFEFHQWIAKNIFVPLLPVINPIVFFTEFSLAVAFLLGFLNLGVVELERFQSCCGGIRLLHTVLDERSDQPAQIGSATKALIATGELKANAVFHRPAIVEAFEDVDCLIVNAAVHVGLREIVVQFAHGFFQRLCLVGIWFCDVAEGNKLLKSGLRVSR